MKSWHLLVPGLVGLAVGIWLYWPENRPAMDHNSSIHSPAEQDDARPMGLPDGNEAAATSPRRGRDTAAREEAGSAPREDSSSNLHKPAHLNRGPRDPDSPGKSVKSVIGGLVQDEYGYPASEIEILAERLEVSSTDPRVADLAQASVRSIYSDRDGHFLFSNLEDGDYRVRLAPVQGIAPAQSTVRAGSLNVSLVAREIKDVWIHGIINSTEGPPLEGVHVIAGPSNRNTRSGSGGGYGLFVSREGDEVAYNILFQLEDFRPRQVRLEPSDLDNVAGDFQLDIEMEPLNRRTTVSGSLTDTNGKPVVDKRLNIVTPQLRILHSAQSDVSGNFLFGAVEPAEDYQLMIRPGSGYKNFDINPLVVPNQGLTLDIVLEPSEKGAVSGWMIDPYGNPIPGFSLSLYSTIATGQAINVVGDQQGFFSVEGFPVGGAMLRTNSYPLLAVHGIDVASAPQESILVVLDTGNFVLQGWITDRLGTPVAASSVVLDWNLSYGGLLYHSTRITAASLDGSFYFTDVGPGPHTLQVSAAGFNTTVEVLNVGADPDEFVIELEEALE